VATRARAPAPRARYLAGNVGTRLRRVLRVTATQSANRSRDLPCRSGPSNGKSSPGARAPMPICSHAFARVRVRAGAPRQLCAMNFATRVAAHEWPEGDTEPLKYCCLPARRSHAPAHVFETKMRCVSSVTTKTSSRTWAWATTKAEAGGAFSITPGLSIAPMASCSLSDYNTRQDGGKKTPHNSRACPTHALPTSGKSTGRSATSILNHQLADPHRRAPGPHSSALPVAASALGSGKITNTVK